jgi:hypothetical protein
MITKLLKKLKKENRSIKWFHNKFVKKKLLSYKTFVLQVSGVEPMHESVSKIVGKYLSE